MLRSLLLTAVVASTAGADALPVPRVVASYDNHNPRAGQIYGIALLGDVLYARDEESLLVVNVSGVWAGNASFTTTKVAWPEGFYKQYAWTVFRDVVRSVANDHYAIDVRNRTAPTIHMYPEEEAYRPLCFSERNGSAYAARYYGHQVYMTDVRSPSVALPKIDVTPYYFGFVTPQCTEELLVVGTSIVDIRDVNAPKLLGDVPRAKSPHDIEEVVLDGKRKLMFTWAGAYLYTYDMTNPARPVELSGLELVYKARPTMLNCSAPVSAGPAKAAPKRVGGVNDNGYFMQLVDDVLYLLTVNNLVMVSVKSPTQPVVISAAGFAGGLLSESFNVQKVGGTVYGVVEGFGASYGLCFIAMHSDA